LAYSRLRSATEILDEEAAVTDGLVEDGLDAGVAFGGLVGAAAAAHGTGRKRRSGGSCPLYRLNT
jgi:hypothetical protein